MTTVLHRLAAFAARRPAAVVAVTALLALAGGLLALRLQVDAGTDTLVGKDSDAAQATEAFREEFGDDAIFVLVRQDLDKLVTTSDLGRVLGLEGCIAGTVPQAPAQPGRKLPGGPCRRLAQTKPVQVVFGPGTFINEAIGQITDGAVQRLVAAQAQGEEALRAAQRDLLAIVRDYGLTSLPTLDNPEFVRKIVFQEGTTPKRRFASLFPTRDDGPGRAALITVRLKPGLSDRAERRAIADIRAATQMREWRLEGGGSYTVSGAPVVVADLTDAITGSILALLIAALLVMAATLALVFSSRLRLLPLLVALVAAGLTFGGLSLAGASLTMASIAVLPVLIGLAVDYAIQLQSRISEEQQSGISAPAAARRAALLGAPTVATAAAATAAGFCVLVLSPVPMVRGFGILLVIGVAVAFCVALVAGTAAVVLTSRGRPQATLDRAGARVLPGLRGARRMVLGSAVAQRASRGCAVAGWAALRLAVRHPRRVLAVAFVLAAAGWALDTQAEVESDIQKLVPQDLAAIRDLKVLQDTTGISGEIDVLVRSTAEGGDDDLGRPEVIRWMSRAQGRILDRYGAENGGCGGGDVCAAFSLPDLFATEQASSSAGRIDALLDAVPRYFAQSVISEDRRAATLIFGIRLMPLDEQQDVVEGMEAILAQNRPAGVDADLAGLSVLAAEANEQVSSPVRRFATIGAGLLAVALVLLLAFRRPRRALVPLVPIALATGWSALLLFGARVELNPMSVTLGALVIAITTEFSVLLSERYGQERDNGHAPTAALARTYRSTGAAVLASGATAIAGFAVLVVSDIPMLRDFGWVTVIDLSASLLGVLLVLPAVLILAEGPLRGSSVERSLREPSRHRRKVAA